MPLHAVLLPGRARDVCVISLQLSFNSLRLLARLVWCRTRFSIHLACALFAAFVFCAALISFFLPLPLLDSTVSQFVVDLAECTGQQVNTKANLSLIWRIHFPVSSSIWSLCPRAKFMDSSKSFRSSAQLGFGRGPLSWPAWPAAWIRADKKCKLLFDCLSHWLTEEFL